MNAGGVAARFNDPADIAVDATGNLYVADMRNHRIRKINPAGEVSTFAGSTQGFADGTGAAASFYWPHGVDVDAAGNVYVADYGNNRIRKITPGGTVTTLAGSGAYSYADGSSTTAAFRNPDDLVVDASGNVFVSDSDNNRIRKITPSGTVSTFAGSGANGYADGSGTSAQIEYPQGIAINESGTLYVADSDNSRVRIIAPNGSVTTLAGSSSGYLDGAGMTARFNHCEGVAVGPDGSIYVADPYNQLIRKIVP